MVSRASQSLYYFSAHCEVSGGEIIVSSFPKFCLPRKLFTSKEPSYGPMLHGVHLGKSAAEDFLSCVVSEARGVHSVVRTRCTVQRLPIHDLHVTALEGCFYNSKLGKQLCIYLFIYLYCGAGWGYHVASQRFLQYIKYIIVELTPSTQLCI